MSSITDPQARIAELEAELAAVRQALQEFTYAVSHDLRAPLRHIVSFAGLVQDEAGPALTEELRGFLETVSDSADHLAAMLDGLRELSRIGARPHQIATVPLKNLIEEVWGEVAQRYAPRVLNSELNLPDVLITSDIGLIRVVLDAIVDNAWKFTSQLPRGTATASVEAHLALDNSLTLTVRDNGLGCASAQANAATRVFTQLHADKAFGGLGLGLAFAEKAVKRLGGSIHLASGEPVGCVLTVRFPNAIGPD